MKLTEIRKNCVSPAEVTRLDQLLAGPMFILSFGWLAALGAAGHFWGDEQGRFGNLSHCCVTLLLWTVPLFLLEALAHWISGRKCPWQNLVACLFPPLRLVLRDHVTGQHIWLPRLGWRKADRELAEEVERRVGYPMIGIALLMVPLLAIEHFYAEKLHAHPHAAMALEGVAAMIWTAFAAEFLIMFSLVTKRVRFIKQHWLDLAIICLPLIAFLRSLRVVRIAKLTRTARVFRLRGLVMRAWRAVLVLEIINRLLVRDPEKRLVALREQLAEKESEVEELRRQIAALEEVVSHTVEVEVCS